MCSMGAGRQVPARLFSLLRPCSVVLRESGRMAPSLVILDTLSFVLRMLGYWLDVRSSPDADSTPDTLDIGAMGIMVPMRVRGAGS